MKAINKVKNMAIVSSDFILKYHLSMYDETPIGRFKTWFYFILLALAFLGYCLSKGYNNAVFAYVLSVPYFLWFTILILSCIVKYTCQRKTVTDKNGITEGEESPEEVYYMSI